MTGNPNVKRASTSEPWPLVLPLDDVVHGLVIDVGEEANPHLAALPEKFEDELLWLVLQRLHEQGV
jgi:hypothetical protein